MIALKKLPLIREKSESGSRLAGHAARESALSDRQLLKPPYVWATQSTRSNHSSA
jgi:hypothetical protein